MGERNWVQFSFALDYLWTSSWFLAGWCRDWETASAPVWNVMVNVFPRSWIGKNGAIPSASPLLAHPFVAFLDCASNFSQASATYLPKKAQEAAGRRSGGKTKRAFLKISDCLKVHTWNVFFPTPNIGVISLFPTRGTEKRDDDDDDDGEKIIFIVF